MIQPSNDNLRKQVREQYRLAAENENCGDGCCSSSCCQGPIFDRKDISLKLGYSNSEIDLVPAGANLGLGCGNPMAIASLKTGETVLDLGSGGGFDCFLAADEVGASGTVIGVDMTPEMVHKARANAEQGGYDNVQFRLGEIEHLPVADGVVDVIISNCVINLSPEKATVFQEAYRVLKPGGRLAISDVIALAELPEHLKNDPALWSGCMAGASLITDLEAMLKEAGFAEIQIKPKDESKEFISQWAPNSKVEDYLVSALIASIKA